MAEPKGWATVRVRVETKDRLRALARRLSAAAQRGVSAVARTDQPCTGDREGGVTLDAALCRALDVTEAKMRRSNGGRQTPPPAGPTAADRDDDQGGMLDLDELAAEIAEYRTADVREKGGIL